MTVNTKPAPIISSPIAGSVETRLDSESPTISNLRDKEQFRKDWQAAIDTKLIEWGRDPSQLDEEGATTPSVDTIQLAIQLASELSRQASRPPTRVVPDVHGGIVFELQVGNSFESVHVYPDRSIEYRLFVNHRLELRETWALETDYNQ